MTKLIPSLKDLPAKPRRIILHWTAGSSVAGTTDLNSYHYVIDGTGKVHQGVPVASNMRSVNSSSKYAAHTRGMNSYSVGVSFAGMFGAQPKGPYGRHPLTEQQVLAGCFFIGELCKEWQLPVNPNTVHTHSEAEFLHGVKQNGKWDIDVLPWLPQLSKQEVWDQLRTWIRNSIEMKDVNLNPIITTPQKIDVNTIGKIN